MRIAEYKQVSVRIEQRIKHHPAEMGEDGALIREAWDETVQAEVPVMGTTYRDMTDDEIAELEQLREDMPAPQPTTEERVDALEQANDDIILMMADLIGG